MGGDVFGNGMLLSKHIRLVGAFNHLHIFCDPNPNIETSCNERERLFKAVKGWDDYNQSYLSKGGKIYSRHDKILKLSGDQPILVGGNDNTLRNEALSALVALGFPKNTIEKQLKSILSANADVDSVEDVIKLVLKQMR